MAGSTITAGAVWARLVGPPEVLAAAREALTVLDPSAQYNRAFNSGHWDGKVRFVQRAGGDFLAGLTWRVAAAVVAAGHPRPRIVWPEARWREPTGRPLLGMEWRPYQLDAVGKALRAGRLALQCPTRGGKTEIGIEFVRRTGGRALWVTHLRGLLDQTSVRFRDRLGVECALVGAGKNYMQRMDSPVTVGMVQTLAGLVKRVPGYFQQFDCLVMDEAHHAGAATWQAVAGACVNATRRLGLSGTMRTGDVVTDLRIEGALGPTYEVATTMELAGLGFVAAPRVVLLRVPPTTYPAYEEVREAVCPSWRDDPQGLLSKLGGPLFRESYRRGVTENEARNRRVVEVAARHAGAGEKFLVLCNRVPHATALHVALLRCGVVAWALDGACDDETRGAAISKFKAHPGGAVLVCTPFFREGFDVPQIDAGMLAGGGESSIAVLQALGRMLTVRRDKPEVIIYDFLDGRDASHEKDYLANHLRSRLALYEKSGFAVERA